MPEEGTGCRTRRPNGPQRPDSAAGAQPHRSGRQAHEPPPTEPGCGNFGPLSRGRAALPTPKRSRLLLPIPALPKINTAELQNQPAAVVKTGRSQSRVQPQPRCWFL